MQKCFVWVLNVQGGVFGVSMFCEAGVLVVYIYITFRCKLKLFGASSGEIECLLMM